MAELILEKARELFFSYGVKSVSMDDVARVAGVSKKTVYQFYSDKNELVNKIVEQLEESHLQLFNECAAKSKDAVEEVLMQSNAPFDTWASVNQSFYYELKKSFPENWQKLQDHKNKILLPGIIKNLKRGIQEKTFRQDLDVASIADIRLSHISDALQPSSFTERKLNEKELMNELTGFYLHAITTEQGKKLLYKYLKNRNEN
jgi:AcrR family transcriptional regulator